MIFVFLLSGSLAYIIFPLSVVQTLCIFSFFFASTLREAYNSEFLLVRSPLIWIVPPWLKKMQFHKLFVQVLIFTTCLVQIRMGNRARWATYNFNVFRLLKDFTTIFSRRFKHIKTLFCRSFLLTNMLICYHRR